ncbi:MAG TPA: hypothetical protein VIH18_28095 [Candidatus Binatia bacterium]|jgi:hypothetical protein
MYTEVSITAISTVLEGIRPTDSAVFPHDLLVGGFFRNEIKSGFDSVGGSARFQVTAGSTQLFLFYLGCDASLGHETISWL